MALALVFPGQGSQSVGMLAELAAEFDTVKNTFAEASEALGYDLWEVASLGPAERLNQTEVTQPAVLTGGVAVWRVYRELGGAMPAFMAGHSLGEYSALVCAGSLAFTDAVKLVAARGRFMQAAVPTGTGAMAAVIGLEDEQVAEACKQVGEQGLVSPANYNAPGQVVIAGESAAVNAAGEAAKALGARKVMPLAVSVPSHCALMKPAAEQLAPLLQATALTAPEVPVLHNVDAAARNDADAIRQALTEQLYQPVRWTQTVQQLLASNVEQLAECGPGKVLAGLIKRIHRRAAVACWQDAAALRDSVSA